jgi:hypothetical protein
MRTALPENNGNYGFESDSNLEFDPRFKKQKVDALNKIKFAPL